jgi:CelD/BcsL family acetyltransferase involved in cellulose biosynthesis
MAIAESNKPPMPFAIAPTQAVPQAGTHSLPHDAALAHVHNLADFARLEADWRELESQSPATSLFQSFDWLQSWTAVYMTEGNGNQPFIVTGTLGGKLVFAWPLMLQRHGPVKVLRWLSKPLAQYGDVLMAPGLCPRAWLPAALRLIRSESGADMIRLRHVRADATVAPFLSTHFRDSQQHDMAPVLDLTAFANEAAYEARYSSSQRKRRKKIRKNLEDANGPVQFDILDPGPANDDAIAEAVHEKHKWLAERGRKNQALCENKVTAFLRELSHRRGGSVQLVTSRMTVGDKPVSWEIGLRKGSTHFGFITSHRTDLTDYSPGRLHMDLSQRQALRDGMSAFDLMVPNDPHKESWSSSKVEVRDHHLPLTALGRLYGLGYVETARPLLRKAYYAMPPELLKLLKPVTGH